MNMTPQENSLIDEAQPHALEGLDEKALKELQSRLRQARDKNFSLLRRQGAARVEAEGSRGAAQPANERRGEKVEIIDEALARVNERLDAVRGAESSAYGAGGRTAPPQPPGGAGCGTGPPPTTHCMPGDRSPYGWPIIGAPYWMMCQNEPSG